MSGETLKQAIERILDDESAWIARPSKDVTTRIALAAAMKSQNMEIDHAACNSMFDELNNQLNEERDRNRFLLHALDESVKLQAHYATLLNQYDGGERIAFPNTSAWLDRLRRMS